MVKYSMNRSRRSLLKASGVAAGLGLVPSVTASADRESMRDEAQLDDFAVVGTKTSKTTFRPDAIVVETTYRSPDLKRRYGMTPPKFTETETYDRDDPESDEFPVEGVEVNKERWETYYATEDEWKSFHSNRGADDGVSVQHDHNSREDELCGIGVWNYKKDSNGGYSVSSPINVICYGFDVKDVGESLWFAGWTNDISEHDRYAWDVDRERFVGPGQQPENEYEGLATSKHREFGGLHARCYELEDGIVSIQAHEDDTLYKGHSVESYTTARDEVEHILTLEQGVESDGSLYLANSKGDHNGVALKVKSDKDSINRSC